MPINWLHRTTCVDLHTGSTVDVVIACSLLDELLGEPELASVHILQNDKCPDHSRAKRSRAHMKVFRP